jgi:hypothetical protein
MKATINVPESWLEQITMPEFVRQLEDWLAEKSPCDICGGHGTVNTGDGIHMGPDDEDRPCPDCKYEEWENPLCQNG